MQRVYNKPLITLKNRKARLGFAKKTSKRGCTVVEKFFGQMKPIWKNTDKERNHRI